MQKSTRREFFQQTAVGTSLALLAKSALATPTPVVQPNLPQTYGKPLDLAPAQWIWLPSGRTLPNTFLFFRKSFVLTEKPTKATGWVLGESRYKLYANAQRIQWGPAPFDPRWAEADPVDLSDKLIAGINTIGTEVLYYGFGDGTMPIGKPGFILKLDLEYASGRRETIISDETWQVKVAHAWKPGQYKRWYLRSLQEEFDARLYPANWHNAPDDGSWFAAALIPGSAPNKPTLASWARDYLYDAGGGNLKDVELRQRSVAMINETLVPVQKLTEQAVLRWKASPDDFFAYNMAEKDCFTATRQPVATQTANGTYSFTAQKESSVALTFEFATQSVGFPYFTIEAPEGTVVELLVHEAHDPTGPYYLLNTHFNAWTRFICKAGLNRFEVFDYESLRWLQLHIRQAEGPVRVSDIGMRRREYPFANPPRFSSSDKKLEKLFSAAINTTYNNSQETIVDGMARERQQYSGDLGHMVHAIQRGFGETAILARFLNTYSQGITKAGFFLDTWPAYDRLARLMEREIGITEWGPLLDHGVGFNFDCYYYYLYTADTVALREVYPRLKTFFNYLKRLPKPEGTLPVEGLGIPTVWIDHTAYKKQKHKECAFSLYGAAMCREALSKLAIVMNEPAFAREVLAFGNKLLLATQKKFWDAGRRAYVCNKPWAAEEGEIRFCDRSLAMAVLHDLNPTAGSPGSNTPSVDILVNRPANLGMSYVTNANWRYWALAKGKRIDVVLNEFRQEWFNSPAVQQNNTLAEFMDVKPDTNHQWSHASLAPMFSLYMDVAGIKPTQPGYATVRIEPQLGNLETLSLTNYTVRGPIETSFGQRNGQLEATITLPEGITGVFVWKGTEKALKSGLNRFSS